MVLVKFALPASLIVLLGVNLGNFYGSYNFLKNLDASPNIMKEEVVLPEFIDPIIPTSFQTIKKQSPMELMIRSKNPLLLDTSNENAGWEAILKVYKKTLKGVTKKQLINYCSSLLSGDITSMSIVDFDNRRRVIKKFCSFPVKVKNKLNSEMIYKYKSYSPASNDDFPWSMFGENHLKMSGNPCFIFLESYTVSEDVTLREMDFIKKCYSVVKSN